MSRLALGQQHAIPDPHQFISKMNYRIADILQMCPHDDLVIVMRRSAIAAACVHYGDEAAVVLLHLAIGESKLPQQFNPANFKPNEVIGMIDHTHLIGFRVAHP